MFIIINKFKEYDKYSKKLNKKILLANEKLSINKNKISEITTSIQEISNEYELEYNRTKNTCKEFKTIENDENICIICMENLYSGIETSCKHTFHLHCINSYVGRILESHKIEIKCPICRSFI